MAVSITFTLLILILFLFKNKADNLINPLFIFLIVHISFQFINLLLKEIGVYIPKRQFSFVFLSLYIIYTSIYLIFFKFGQSLNGYSSKKKKIIVLKYDRIQNFNYLFFFIATIGTGLLITIAIEETGAKNFIELFIYFYAYLDQNFFVSGLAYLWYFSFVSGFLSMLLLLNKINIFKNTIMVFLCTVYILFKADYLYIFFLFIIYFYLIYGFSKHPLKVIVTFFFLFVMVVNVNYMGLNFISKIAPYTFINYDTFSLYIKNNPIELFNINFSNFSEFFGPLSILFDKIIGVDSVSESLIKFYDVGKISYDGSLNMTKSNVYTFLGNLIDLGLIPSAIYFSIYSFVAGYVFTRRYKNIYFYLLNVSFCFVSFVSIGGWIVSFIIIYLPIIYLFLGKNIFLQDLEFGE